MVEQHQRQSSRYRRLIELMLRTVRIGLEFQRLQLVELRVDRLELCEIVGAKVPAASALRYLPQGLLVERRFASQVLPLPLLPMMTIFVWLTNPPRASENRPAQRRSDQLDDDGDDTESEAIVFSIGKSF